MKRVERYDEGEESWWRTVLGGVTLAVLWWLALLMG